MKLHNNKKRSCSKSKKTTRWSRWKNKAEKQKIPFWVPPEDRKEDQKRPEVEISDKETPYWERYENEEEKKKEKRGVCIITYEESNPCAVDFSVDFSV